MKPGQSRRVVPILMPLLVAALLAACATSPPPAPTDQQVVVDESAMLPLLGYLQLLPRMSPLELSRERAALAVKPQTPAAQIRLAAILGQPRAPTDLVRALGLLETVLKSSEPAAVSVHPLARVMTNHYQERLKLEQQNDRLSQQLRENQRRVGELQEKIDALADIERSLPVRPPVSDTLPGASR